MAVPGSEQAVPETFRTRCFDYELPEELIAQTPAERREDARLLHLDCRKAPLWDLEDKRVPDLVGLFREGDLLVLNDTQVVPARVLGFRAKTGGQVDVLIVERASSTLRLLLRTRGKPRAGEVLALADGELELVLEESLGDGLWQANLVRPNPETLEDLLKRRGRVPLPPYIHRSRGEDSRDELDRERYQTSYAERPGAVAAPTAGLHLTRALLRALADRGVELTAVTLHVGLGTFRPVMTEDLRQHVMHEEAYEVTPEAAAAVARCRQRGGRIIPVGTTAVRVLETAALDEGGVRALAGRTSIFIHGAHRFRLVDALLTNFHAPRSTLLMLVAALAGRERILRAYQHAVHQRYRFLSYGDAMLIELR